MTLRFLFLMVLGLRFMTLLCLMTVMLVGRLALPMFLFWYPSNWMPLPMSFFLFFQITRVFFISLLQILCTLRVYCVAKLLNSANSLTKLRADLDRQRASNLKRWPNLGGDEPAKLQLNPKHPKITGAKY